jgi:hypothetical protein
MKPLLGDPLTVAWLGVVHAGTWLPSLGTALVQPVCVNIRQDSVRLI